MSSQHDHRDIIAAYDLGHIEEHSPGLIHWHPSGARVLERIEHWLRKLHGEHGYQEVRSPSILSRQLWEKSGHWDKYQDLMFVAGEGPGAYAVKPMSCPGQIGIYAHKRRSWRELPMRMFEFGHVHRNEPSGALSGWLRLRGFVQDDSHVFCRPAQVREVIERFVSMVGIAYPLFGFQKVSWRLALRPDKRAGSDAVWDQAEQALRDACRALGIEPMEAPGEGAFYGPKLEAAIEDRLGRSWQCGVAQVDFVLPQRFVLAYQDESGQQQEPVIIHHAVLGSIERWLAIAMEHLGRLPDWLSPHPAVVLPVGGDQDAYCQEIVDRMRSMGIAAQMLGSDPLPGRIRDAQQMLAGHIAVAGKREVEAGSLSVRQPDGKSIVMPAQAWIEQVAARVAYPSRLVNLAIQ